MLKGRFSKIILALAVAILVGKAAADVMGYRILDIVSNNRDKESGASYGASHK
jgi:hypothetical protein